MKKLFFFKSSASSSGSNNATPPKTTNKQMSWDNFSDSGMNNQAHGKSEDYFQSSKGLFSKSRKQVSDSQSSCGDPGLRRSRSLSSGAYQFKDPNRSPSSSIASDPYRQFEHSSRCQALDFEKPKPDKPTRFAVSSVRNSHIYESPGSTNSSRSHHESSGNSSTSSSNVSSKIVDRYIDGEQQPEESRPRNNSQRNNTRHGNYGTKLPPKIQHTAPNSPTDGVKDKPRTHSFREAKVTHFSSRDWTENGFGHESPRSLAKNVIERLSRTCDISKTSSKNFDVDKPITINDIYARSVNGRYDSDLDDAVPKSYLLDEPYRMTNGYHGMDGNCEGLSFDEAAEDADAELMRRSKEAEERVILLSKKLERENFFPDGGYDVPTLIQIIRNLVEEKISLALEVSTHLRSQISDRTSAREELRRMKEELEFRTRRLEKEKNEMQSASEKELDRRSSDWSFKLEKYQLEEQRLRERVLELAEQNVSLQREVSTFSEGEMESKSAMTYTDQQLKGVTEKTEKMKEEILDLQQNLLELQEKCKIAEENRDSMRRNFVEKEKECKELRRVKEELEFRTRRLEKEKNEMQSALEKELDRRSSDWSFKHEKYQLEEQRLRERVRELAEQNVSLQREVSTFSEREMENKSAMTYTDQQLKGVTEKTEKMKEEILDLQQNLLELQEKCKITEENRDSMRRNFEEKEKECKELHKSLTRLFRTCSEQQKTITGLQDCFSEDLHKNQSMESFNKHIAQMQMEQMRLTGVELALRRELESYRFGADSLRHEIIILLDRLKGDGKECVAATYKLDIELWARICCLQNQGLTMLNESTYLCSKLLEFMKGKGGHLRQNIQLDQEVIGNGLDGQFIIESETKIQSLKSGTEGLTRSLQMMSSLLKEKSNPLTSKYQSECIDADILAKLNDQSSEDIIRTELKAECLVTSLLREKLYSKEREVEQMQAELAAAVRGNDILRSEVQDALDNLSSVKHELKALELQILKKNESINCLENDLQRTTRELKFVEGRFDKVLGERDLMWEKKVNELKEKIEELDGVILVKEGEITILKDSLDPKPFDLLGSPDSMHEFLRS